VKILVSIKRVADPDNASKLKVSGDGTAVTSEGLEWKMNPFDDWSLEAALRLTENAAERNARVGEVVLVSIGPNDEHTQRIIREGLAKGAERGILVEAEDGALDSGAVAGILKAIVDKESPDLVVMGKQAADGDSNVAGTVLAEKLGWPIINSAMSIKTGDDGKTLEVKRELEGGAYEVVELPKPCLAAIQTGANQVRYASLKGIMQAKKKPIDNTSVADLGVDAGKTLNYTKFELPPARSGETTFVEDVADLVDKLHNTAKVI